MRCNETGSYSITSSARPMSALPLKTDSPVRFEWLHAARRESFCHA